MRVKIQKECFHRVSLILRSELNARNRIDAINSLVLPVVTHRLYVINWPLIEIKKFNTKICKILTTHRMQHLKVDVFRLYLPHMERGKRLVTSSSLLKSKSKINLCTLLPAMRKNI